MSGNINRYLINTLKPITGKNIWPLICPYENKPDKYIIFIVEYDAPGDHGDNSEYGWLHFVSVLFFKRSSSKNKPANIINERSEIRRRLIEAGFSVTRIQYFHDTETGYSQLEFSVNIPEEDTEEVSQDENGSNGI